MAAYINSNVAGTPPKKHTVIFTTTTRIEDGVTVTAASPHAWAVPAGCTLISASYCGGGNSGAPGHVSSGAAGGGGGASSTVHNIPIPVLQGDTLTITVGAKGASPAVGATYGTTHRGGITSITGHGTGIALPTARPARNAATDPTAGGATNGGNGGAGAPLWPTTGGPAGGTGATGAADATVGANALYRGQYITTGGAGGGGGNSGFLSAGGGSDTQHADFTTGNSAGGCGGASHFGKGDVGDAMGGTGFGFGGIGGDGNGAGGQGGDGIVVFEFET